MRVTSERAWQKPTKFHGSDAGLEMASATNLKGLSVWVVVGVVRMKFDAHGRSILRAKRDPEIEEIDRARRRLWRESKNETQCHFEIVVSQSRVNESAISKSNSNPH